MCTVTFLPRPSGYCLAMNRDEQRSRVQGLPPSSRRVHGRLVVHPSEPNGGTWISLNDAGVTLALINWYAVAERVGGLALSRGRVVLAARSATAGDRVLAALAQLPLRSVNPFRLIGVFPATRVILEWQWDLSRLTILRHKWTAQQWISSGFNEARAQRERSRTFRQALGQRSFGTPGWLRRLHRSHQPSAGPFSICMHRADAATVSYTETVVSPGLALMRYQAGNPCQDGGIRSGLRASVCAAATADPPGKNGCRFLGLVSEGGYLSPLGLLVRLRDAGREAGYGRTSR